MSSEIEQKIGKYEVLSKIGEGGMGVVYKAKDPLIDRIVAIKMMTGAFAEEKESRERFLREARAVGRLQHPNIVTIYELGVEGNSPYMVMEFLEGQGLDKIVSTRMALSMVQKLEYMEQICQALHYAHEHDIVHRDVKPANVIVMKGGTQVKLVDFGIARAGNSGMTRTGFAIGTTSYMSPEQIEASKGLDRRSDVFSAGVMMYEVLTNNLPFPGTEPIAIAIKILREPFPRLAAYLAEYPAELDDIMNRALAKDRDERYSTAEEFAFDLSRLIEQLKRNMVSQYVVEGRESFGRKDFSKAKELISYVLKIDPGNSEARQLNYEIQKMAQAAQKGEHLRQLKADIVEMIGQRQYDEALNFIEQALKIEPANAELLKQKELVVAEQQRRAEVKKLLNMAQSEEASGEFRLAREHVERALSLDPTDTHARMVKANIEQAMAEQEKQRHIREFLDVAKSEMAERRFTSAREAIKKAEELQPDLPEIQALKAAAYSGHEQELKRRELEQLGKEIQALLAADDAEGALKKANASLQQYPNEISLLQLRTAAEQQRESASKKRKIDELIAKATRLVNEGKSVDAVKVIKDATREFPEEERLQKYLANVSEGAEREKAEKAKQEHLKKAKDALARKSFDSAISTLEAARIEFPASTEIADLLHLAREEKEKAKLAADKAAAAELAAASKAAAEAAEAAARKKAAEEKLRAEEKQKEKEKQRAEEKRKAEETQRAAEEKQRAEEKRRAEEKQRAAEKQRAEEKHKADVAAAAAAAAKIAAATAAAPAKAKEAGVYEETVVAPPVKKPAAIEKPRREEPAHVAAPAPPSSGSGKMIGIGAAVAVVVLGAGSYFVFHKSTPPPTETPATTETTPAPPAPTKTAPGPATPAAPALGSLSVDAKDDKGAGIDGADIFVDNQLNPSQVKGGHASLKLAPGKHQVRVEKPGYGAAPAQSVTIAKDGEAHVAFALVKSAEAAVVKPVNPYLMITSTAGATIKVDDKTIDNVRPDGTFSFQVEPGRHKVEISLRGHKPFTTSINAKAGDRLPVNGPLAAIPPPTVDFSAGASSIQEGQSTELKWSTQGATEVTIEGIGPVSPSGSRQVSPKGNTTYTLVAKGEGEPTTRSVTVSVAATPAPAIGSFAANSTTITKGDKARLTWATSNANDVSISGIGKVEASGSREISPADTTSYKLTAKGPGGSVDSQPVRITVNPPTPTGPSPAEIAAQQKAKDVADAAAVVDSFKSAYEAKSIDGLQKAWPSIPAKTREAIAGSFKMGSAKFTFNCKAPSINGDSGQATCSEIATVEGRPNTVQITLDLQRAAGGWKVVNLKAGAR